MKVELGRKIIKEIAGLRAKTNKIILKSTQISNT